MTGGGNFLNSLSLSLNTIFFLVFFVFLLLFFFVCFFDNEYEH